MTWNCRRTDWATALIVKSRSSAVEPDPKTGSPTRGGGDAFQLFGWSVRQLVSLCQLAGDGLASGSELANVQLRELHTLDDHGPFQESPPAAVWRVVLRCEPNQVAV